MLLDTQKFGNIDAVAAYDALTEEPPGLVKA